MERGIVQKLTTCRNDGYLEYLGESEIISNDGVSLLFQNGDADEEMEIAARQISPKHLDGQSSLEIQSG